MPSQRAAAIALPSATMTYAGAQLCTADNAVRVNGVLVDLTPVQRSLLAALIHERPEPVALQTLFVAADLSGVQDAVHNHLFALHESLAAVHPDAGALIESVVGAGYRIRPAACPDIASPFRFQFRAGNAVVALSRNDLLQVDTTPLHLTPQEIDLFVYLAERPGVACTREDLMKKLNAERDWAQQKILDVLVCHLRRKLAAVHEDAGLLIDTVWGRGYRIREFEPGAQFAPILRLGSKQFFDQKSARVADLPPPNCRWVPSRKALVVWLLEDEKVTMADVLARYPDLTEAEVKRWQVTVRTHGTSGLRVTQLESRAA